MMLLQISTIRWRRHGWFTAVLIVVLGASSITVAEDGSAAWLRYARLDHEAETLFSHVPHSVIVLGESPLLQSAREELGRGLNGMLGITVTTSVDPSRESAIVLGTVDQVSEEVTGMAPMPVIPTDGFLLRRMVQPGRDWILVTASNERGVLYGAFALLRKIALLESLESLDERSDPFAPIRFLNHWENLDGSIERGYAGRSIFWENGRARADLGRVRDYARLMASVGINGCLINNVNADARVVSAELLPDVARIAAELRSWGVQTLIALDFASPRTLGGIDTFDPLDARAIAFWRETTDQVYSAIPDLAGFVLKADSEGRLGPSSYGRSHADAAHAIAQALKPYHGLLFYRGFVYNHKMDWRDYSNDRAKAAYDNFHHLDGRFADNVVIQIKNGPIDFQVREPASPLFGGLTKTNQAIELQITQEYLGQQWHVCYLVPMWKEVLDEDLHAAGPNTPVKQLVAGKIFDRPWGGFVGVSNVGLDSNWLGHHLAQANLYGFGRLAWDPNRSAEEIAREWVIATFGHDAPVVTTIVNLLMQSWPVYEKYTGPLGIGTLTDIIHIHFGPAPESSEYNGWGQWHRANETGVGMDRTEATGTGFISQYHPSVATRYEELATCPDDLLLFMQHVPYTHRLKSGKTVIQHFYDTHYDGAEEAEAFVDQWRSLEGRIDDQRYREVLDRLEYQAGHAQVWRDAICDWFYRRSGIADEEGRVGNHPNRHEAEAMRREGYEVVPIVPWEAGSGGHAVHLPEGTEHGAIEMTYQGVAGPHDIRVQYFDEEDGVSRFRLIVSGTTRDEWLADHQLPTPTILSDAHSSKHRWVRGLSLEPGDSITIEAWADQGERAAIDYVELVRTRSPRTGSSEQR